MRRSFDKALTKTLAVAHHGLAVIGLVAVLAALAGYGSALRRGDADLPASLGPVKQIRFAAGPARPAAHPDSGRYRAITVYLSRRYRIAGDAAEQLVVTAHTVGAEIGIDPLLVLAVIAVESRFNPIAESYAGAKGLMQVMPGLHEDKLKEHGGTVLDPATNIAVGARILQEYIDDSGSLEAGLQSYNGAVRDRAARYAAKVIEERERLRLVVDAFERDGGVF